jgi:putative transcriptional regulator
MFEDLKQSLQEMEAYLAGDVEGARVHHVSVPDCVDVKAARQKLGLSQHAFASAFGISPDTLKNWESGRRSPAGAARVLLTVIDRNPQAVLDALRP